MIVYLARCDLCDRTSPGFASEAAMWQHVWSEGWTTVTTSPEHHCRDCAREVTG